MSEQNLQPEGFPGDPSQLGAPTGPDTTRLPLHPIIGGQKPEENWEERYKGMVRRYNEDRGQWEQERAKMNQTLANLQQRLEQLEKATTTPAKAADMPLPGKKKRKVEEEEDSGEAEAMVEVYDRLLELEARTRRDNLLFEYSQPGKPGYGLPLARFRDNIPLVIDDDHEEAEKQQRAAIEGLINALKELQGNTQSQTAKDFISGWTPGASLNIPPSAPSQDQQVQEYYRLKELYGSDKFDTLSPDEQARIQAAYYNLHERIGKHLPGQTQPWMSGEEILEQVRRLGATVGRFEELFLKRFS